MPWELDVESAVNRTAAGEWRGHLTSSWNIGDNPNGRCVASLLGAMTGDAAHPDPVSMTTHHLRPGIADADAVVRTEVLRAGRTTSTVRGTLSQDGSDRITGLATFAGWLLGRPTRLAERCGVVLPPWLAAPAANVTGRTVWCGSATLVGCSSSQRDWQKRVGVW